MDTLEPAWSAYADLQKSLSNTSSVSPRTLALEAALSATLDAIGSNRATRSDNDKIVSRTLNSVNWRERSHRRLRLTHHPSIERAVANEHAPFTVVRLREIRDTLTEADWSLILNVAGGYTYRELSSTAGSTLALRVKVSRIRASLRSAA
jgi:hypothetical protein